MKPGRSDIALAIATHASALDAAAAGGAWVQLVPAGTFTGRDGRGPFDAGGVAAMHAIVERTRKFAGSTDLVIDYDHQSVWGAIPGVGGRAPAAGWIKELEVRPTGIWGRVEWTEAAASAIRAGEYRYLSPVFVHEEKSGKVMLIRMAGLINTPNLDLAEVAAGAFLELSEDGDPMDKIAAALGLAAGSGEDAVLTAINAVLENGTAIAKALGLKDGARPAAVLAAVNGVVADRTRIATAAGKPAATGDELVTAVQSAIQRGEPDPAKFVPIGGFNELQARLKRIEDSAAETAAETAVNKAIEDGKLIPAMREWGLSLHKSDPAKFAEYVDGAPKLTGSQLGARKRGGDGEGLGEADAAVAAALGIDPKALAKTLAEEKDAN